MPGHSSMAVVPGLTDTSDGGATKNEGGPRISPTLIMNFCGIFTSAAVIEFIAEHEYVPASDDVTDCRIKPPFGSCGFEFDSG